MKTYEELAETQEKKLEDAVEWGLSMGVNKPSDKEVAAFRTGFKRGFWTAATLFEGTGWKMKKYSIFTGKEIKGE